MIPLSHLREWTAHAPWPDLRQVEQDLIICRALCDLFSSVQLQGKIAFRGGTAINKLLFSKPLRYSEDIDLVQTQTEPIKDTVSEIRRVLAWLGKCRYQAAAHSVHLEFRFVPDVDGGSQLKLKVEINTREHEPLDALTTYSFEVNSDWHKAKAEIVSFEPEELFGTKLVRGYQSARYGETGAFVRNSGILLTQFLGCCTDRRVPDWLVQLPDRVFEKDKAEYLGERDLYGEMVRAAHEDGIFETRSSTQISILTMSSPSVNTKPASWFVRGFMVGVLITGALNAASYFARSDRGGNLVGTAPGHREALGFPCELWESGNTYGGFYIDFWGLLVNALFLVAVSAVCGLIVFRLRDRLTRLVLEFEEEVFARETRTRGNIQVSLRGLLVMTGLAAMVAAGTRYALAGRPEVLGCIYLFGPWVLVLIAFLPLDISWQHRVAILVPATVFLMLASVVVGWSLKPSMEFDKTLLGIFVCWTPQTVLAAIILMTIGLRHHFRSRGTPAPVERQRPAGARNAEGETNEGQAEEEG